jgi:nitrogen-specific signal transduction histidine kinase
VGPKQIVHELANELTVIRGAAELVHSRLADDLDARRDLREVIASADRSIQLIKELSESYRPRERWPRWRGQA